MQDICTVLRRSCPLRGGLVLALALATGLPAAKARASVPLPATAAGGGDDDTTPGRRWDATVGFIGSWAPEYDGAASHGFSLVPGGAIRYGRVSISSRSAFAVRGTAAGAQGGLRVDLSRGRPWRASLGLRWDGGRQAADSPALQGLGDIRGTLLVRLHASMPLGGQWRVRGAVAVDALGRGSGVHGEVGLGRDWPVGEASALNLGGSVGWSGGRHMRSYYGITPQQAQASGYAVYTPGAGLREATLALGMRTPVDRRWTLFGSASLSHPLGPAADSPITRRASGWAASLGTAYRF